MALKSTATSKGKQKRQAPATAEEKKPSRAQPRTLYYAVAIIVVTVLASYANSLENEFVFDDKDLVIGAIREQRFASITDLLSSYRPVRTMTYAIDYMIWGERPLGFHLTNILIHAGTCVLAFLLIRRLTGAMLISLLGALIFAVHPIQTDSVTYISGRRDVLFGFFYLAAFLNYLNYASSRARSFLALIIIFWTMSLLSKEMAISFPAIIFLWNFCHIWSEQEGSFFGRSVRAARHTIAKEKWLYLTLITIAAAFAFYSVVIKKASQRISDEGLIYYGGSFYETLLTSVRAQAWYLKQLVFPTPIVQYHGAFDLSTSILDWRVIGSLVLVGSVFISGFILLRRNTLMAFAILSYFAMLAPVSQIIPHHEFVADHYLYLPMVCFVLFVVLIAQKLEVRGEIIKKAAYAVIILAVIALATLTVMRNRVWKDSLTLWEDNYRAVPTSSRAAFNLGSEYENWNPKRAEELFLKSIEIDPSLPMAYTKLSKIYLTKNRTKEAEELVQSGLAMADEKLNKLSGRDAARFRSELLTDLAAIRNQQGRDSEAEQALEQSLELNPSNTISRLMLALRYKESDKEKYSAILKEGLKANPSSIEILHALANSMAEDRRYEEAISYLKNIAEIRPRDFYANYQLGRSYRLLKDCRGAIEYSQAALESAANSEDLKNARELVQIVARDCGRAK